MKSRTKKLLGLEERMEGKRKAYKVLMEYTTWNIWKLE
jgi:hypothetical protein